MWSIYGVDSPNVEGVTNPKSIIIGNFKPSESITENDFNNAGKSFLCIHPNFLETAPSVYRADSNKFSMYIESGSFPSNLLAYQRFNILHRKAEGNQIVYEYDRCAYEWTFHTSGTNLYYFDAYRLGSLSYSQCPKVYFDRYTNAEITRNYVRTLQLIATTGNGIAGIGCVRPLWGLDFTGLSQFQDNPIQYVLGPIIPASTIEEWLKYTRSEDDPDAPEKPDPESADKHTATSTGFTWLNKFRIMNWSHDEWPAHMLIDGNVTYANFLTDYSAFNENNDASQVYHMEGRNTEYLNWSTDVGARLININNGYAEFGHDIAGCYNKGENTGKFTTYSRTIDDEPSANRVYTGVFLPSPKKVNIGEMIIDYSNSNFSGANTKEFITGSKVFSIASCYPNNSIFFETDFNTSFITFLDCCIIRRGGHYYLGGLCICYSGHNGKVGFSIICRMDNLSELPNYGGDQPGDPADDGVSGRDLDNTFGTGSDTTPNPSTDKEVQGNLGDPNNGGTGEFADPVNSETETNLHDGSVDNGTGDPHEGDSDISDPSGDLPSGVDSAGTVSGTGVISVFTPTLAELTSFTAEMLSPTVLNSIKNFFTTNPMDGIFSLHMLPFTGFEGTAVASPRIGTHNFTATMTLAASEYITIDYGTVYVPFVYDGYENYAPNSDVKLFLPFIGTKDVDINIVQGCNCNLKYNVSLVTGDIYAYLYCQWAGASGQPGTGEGVNHLMYHWQGNCAATIPLSHLDSSNYISGSMRAAGGISSLVAGAVTGNPLAIAGGVMAAGQGLINSSAEKGRTQIITSGNISGVSAFMGCREPYFIFSRPIIAFNSNYNRYVGQYSNTVCRLSELRTGTFTKMVHVDLAGIPATGDELNEIESILKGGFYI